MIYLELFLSFLLVGFTSFGGISMIPLISDQVISHGWMTAAEVSDLVAIAEITPGSLALNCSTFAGIRTAGPLGDFVAALGVLTPSYTLCIAVTVGLKKFRESKLMGNMLYGIRPACVGMILSVIITLSKSNYLSAGHVSLSSVALGLMAALLLFRFKWSIPRVLLVSAFFGLGAGLIK